MKFAVLISGHVRNGLDYFQQNYNFFIKDLNPDIYIHSYKCPEMDDIIKLYKPKVAVFEDEKTSSIVTLSEELADITMHWLKRYGDAHPVKTIFSIVNMWRKRKLCYDLLKTDYDKILLTRFELYSTTPIHSFLNETNLCIPIGGDYPNQFYTCAGICDMMALGPPDKIKNYCMMYDKLSEYILKDNVIIHPETLLKYHLQDEQIKRIPLEFYLRGKSIFNEYAFSK